MNIQPSFLSSSLTHSNIKQLFTLLFFFFVNNLFKGRSFYRKSQQVNSFS